MRRFLSVLIVGLAIVFAATSCKNANIPTLIEGEWHYSDDHCDIYVAFSSASTFELFQRLGEGRYYHYDGTWSLSKGVISGTYSDGTAWGSSYEVDFDGDNTMMLTATNGSSESNTYTRTQIPDEVLDYSTSGLRSQLEESAEQPAPVL